MSTVYELEVDDERWHIINLVYTGGHCAVHITPSLQQLQCFMGRVVPAAVGAEGSGLG